MRILIATGIFPPDIGGPATYSKLLAEELVKRGHEVVIVTYSDVIMSSPRKRGSSDTNSGFPLRSGMTVKVVSRGLPKGIRHLIYFWQVLKNGARADSIYVQDAVSAGFPVAIASFFLRKHFFLKVVGDHAWEQGQQRFGVVDLLDEFLANRYGMRVGLLRVLQKCTARRAKRIIVPSRYLQSVVERWGISDKKIVVIPNVVSISSTRISKSDARAKLGMDGFVLLSIGRLVPWKGFHMLVELMPCLVETIPNIKLIIVGDGPEKEQLKVQIANYKMQNAIRLEGSVPKDQLAVYLSAADIFLLNTGYEGFSHQLIEAMAAGIPIVTTNAGGNKEIIQDGENALVALYNDIEDWERKITSLYKDKNLQQRLRKPNHDILQQYSVENMIQKTESIILNS